MPEECLMCEDCICEPGTPREHLDGPECRGWYGPECLPIARGLNEGMSPAEAVREDGSEVLWEAGQPMEHLLAHLRAAAGEGEQ